MGVCERVRVEALEERVASRTNGECLYVGSRVMLLSLLCVSNDLTRTSVDDDGPLLPLLLLSRLVDERMGGCR